MAGNGRVFISHAHDDNDACQPLLIALDAWGVDYWFDTERLKPGNELEEHIQTAILERDIFIRVCSTASQTSFWVRQETAAFRALQAKDEKSGHGDKRTLINVVLDEGFRPQPFDYATLFIKASGRSRRDWFRELRQALGPTVVSSDDAVTGQERHSTTAIQTMIVDQLGRGAFTSIGDAIKQAVAGSIIQVRPGLYRESLILDKPLEIVGDGQIDDVVIEAEQTVLMFDAQYGRVANLSIRQVERAAFFADDAVVILSGRLEMERCDISNIEGQGIEIRGEANPRIRWCKVHDCGYWGITFRNNARGVLEDNEVCSNSSANVYISDFAGPTIRRNRIYGSDAYGIQIYKQGTGLVEDNDIFLNRSDGLDVDTGTEEQGGNPLVRHNIIHENGGSGINITSKATARIVDNDIHQNGAEGIQIVDGAKSEVYSNQIHQNKGGGIFVARKGSGSIARNDIFENTLSGILIAEGGNPDISNNRIHDGRQGGICIYKKGKATISGNEIVENDLAGVEVDSGSTATLTGNQIREGKHHGVSVHNGAKITLDDNDVIGNLGSGVRVAVDATIVMRNNRVHNHRYDPAVRIEGCQSGVFENNDLSGNANPWDISEGLEDKLTRTDNTE